MKGTTRQKGSSRSGRRKAEHTSSSSRKAYPRSTVHLTDQSNKKEKMMSKTEK